MKITDQTNVRILELLSEGLTAKQIGEKVFLSHQSVNHRLIQMRVEAGAKNTVELVAKFYQSKQKSLPPGEYTVVIREGEHKN